MKHSILTITMLISAFLSISSQPTQAWFGAGSTPGWPHTTTGLRGEIALPHYKFAPDFYWVGDTVSISTTAYNSTPSDVTSNYYFVVSQVIESPLGEDITDGDPDNPGLNENQLYDNQKSGNDLQSIVSVQNLGEITISSANPAGVPGQAVLSGSFTATATGYYQFDFMDINPQEGYEPGHILTAGFFRALQGEVIPSPSPSPSPSPTTTPAPESSPTPTSTPQENDDSDNNNDSGNTDSSHGGTVLGTTDSEPAGQVLGDSTSVLGATGHASQAISYAGLFFLGFFGYLILTKSRTTR